jgi:hypothetical protein
MEGKTSWIEKHHGKENITARKKKTVMPLHLHKLPSPADQLPLINRRRREIQTCSRPWMVCFQVVTVEGVVT